MRHRNSLPYYVCVIQPKEKIPNTGFSKKILLFCTLEEINERLKKVWKTLQERNLDQDELFAKGNTIRTIMEYALKHFCVISGIKLNIEQKYSYIDLSDLKKEIKNVGIEIPQNLINIANELSHDSGRKYNLEDIKTFWQQVKILIKEIQGAIS